MNVGNYIKTAYITLYFWICIIIGSIIPDIDHIPKYLFGALKPGRFAHDFMFGASVILIGCTITLIGGLLLRVVLKRSCNQNNDCQHKK
jgi:formate-dependent nitrite reductase membrane component NrfD